MKDDCAGFAGDHADTCLRSVCNLP